MSGDGADRRPGDEADSGISLVELIVAMSLTVLMLGLVGTMFGQVMRAATDNRATRVATGNAANVMDEITRVVRQGTRVATSATATEGAVISTAAPYVSGATSLVVDSAVDAVVQPGQAAVLPVRVVFTVDGTGALVEQRYPSTLTAGYPVFASTPATTRTLTGALLTTGSGVPPLFGYADRTGAAIVPAASGLTSSQASAVAAVTVTATVTASLSSGANPVQLTNTVTMPNVAISNGGN